MMPFLPIVRVPDVDDGIQAALRAEHGYGHTAMIHSQQCCERDEDGARDEHDAFRPQRAVLGKPGPGRPGIPELQHRDTDRRRRDDAVDFHRQRQIATVGALRIT